MSDSARWSVQNAKPMGRYLKRFGRVGMSLGPSEERQFSMWIGYELIAVEDDLTSYGFQRVDDWSDERLSELGIDSFVRLTRHDADQLHKLGLDHLVQSND